jgi:hypothetical protein
MILSEWEWQEQAFQLKIFKAAHSKYAIYSKHRLRTFCMVRFLALNRPREVNMGFPVRDRLEISKTWKIIL